MLVFTGVGIKRGSSQRQEMGPDLGKWERVTKEGALELGLEGLGSMELPGEEALT